MNEREKLRRWMRSHDVMVSYDRHPAGCRCLVCRDAALRWLPPFGRLTR